MNKKNIIFSIIVVFAVVSTLFFNSCSDNEDIEYGTYNNEFSKDIEVFDDTNKNSVILKISSPDQSIVERYKKENFSLVLNPTNEEIIDECVDEVFDESIEDEIINQKNSFFVSIGVISKNFTYEVEEFEIIETEPDFSDLRASWKEKAYYSQQDGVYCKRTSWNRRVYMTTKYCPSGESCTTDQESIINGWYNGNYINQYVKNGEKIKDHVCDSKFMGVVVKCKKIDDDKYTAGFWNPTANDCN